MACTSMSAPVLVMSWHSGRSSGSRRQAAPSASGLLGPNSSWQKAVLLGCLIMSFPTQSCHRWVSPQLVLAWPAPTHLSDKPEVPSIISAGCILKQCGCLCVAVWVYLFLCPQAYADLKEAISKLSPIIRNRQECAGALECAWLPDFCTLADISSTSMRQQHAQLPTCVSRLSVKQQPAWLGTSLYGCNCSHLLLVDGAVCRLRGLPAYVLDYSDLIPPNR